MLHVLFSTTIFSCAFCVASVDNCFFLFATMRRAQALFKASNKASKNFSTSLLARASNPAHSFTAANTSTVADNLVNVTFVDAEGHHRKCKGAIGQSLLEVAKANHVKLDFDPICDGASACNECHIIVNTFWYEKLPNTAFTEDLHLQNLKWKHKLTKNSRLACQIVLNKDLDGITVAIADPKFDWHFHYGPF